MTTINEDVRQRGRTLTLAWGGEWNEETHKGRKSACPECGVFDVSITPKAGKGVLLICNACSAGARGNNRLVLAAARSGFECGAGNGTKPHRHMLYPAKDEALTGMKRAERRVLKYCASQTSTGEWFELSRREIVAACHISDRDAIPVLKRLEARGLIRVKSNKYACKRRTQIAFRVDPVDLVRRLVDVVKDAQENGTTPSENGTTIERDEKMVPPTPENGTTMERPYVRIREGTSETCSLELEAG
jgi:DNA-binding MarR family transcriptional regulator